MRDDDYLDGTIGTYDDEGVCHHTESERKQF